MSYPSLTASDGREATHLCVTQAWHLLPARLPAAHQGIFQMFQGFLRTRHRGHCRQNHHLDIVTPESCRITFPAKFRVYHSSFVVFFPPFFRSHSFCTRKRFISFVPDVDSARRCVRSFVIKADVCDNVFGLEWICVVVPPRSGSDL